MFWTGANATCPAGVKGAGGAPESILKPLQHQQKARPIPVRHAPEPSQVLPPAPTRLRSSAHANPNRPAGFPSQPIKCSSEHFSGPAATRTHPCRLPSPPSLPASTRCISAGAARPESGPRRQPDIHTRAPEFPCQIKEFRPTRHDYTQRSSFTILDSPHQVDDCRIACCKLGAGCNWILFGRCRLLSALVFWISGG